MYTRKNLPKSQYELSKGSKDQRITRADQVRRDNDTLKELTVGLKDIDYAIKWYFDNVIKPEVSEFGSITKVPVIYGSPEKWKSMQADGYFRDKEGKILVPLIAFKRVGVTKNKTLGSKVDANYPQLYYTQEIKYNQYSRYDQFSVLNNIRPPKAYINTIIPEYVELVYDVVIWTDFMDHMNSLVESVLYSEGSYWGDPEKFKFRSKIDNFTNTTDLIQDSDRTIRTTFQLTLSGYIVTDALVKNLSKHSPSKAYEPSQIAVDITPDTDPTVYQQFDETKQAPETDRLTSSTEGDSLFDPE